ncbi:protein of unknown function [Nitrospira defluvii]|uniref:Uncharacterized protein n=1 Tax=Nitrospira defluvii TaxID=330214 RepID=D8PJ78_9BACT|nr:protein of unknown function [Nitrospira defluvii]
MSVQLPVVERVHESHSVGVSALRRSMPMIGHGAAEPETMTGGGQGT